MQFDVKHKLWWQMILKNKTARFWLSMHEIDIPKNCTHMAYWSHSHIQCYEQQEQFSIAIIVILYSVSYVLTTFEDKILVPHYIRMVIDWKL